MCECIITALSQEVCFSKLKKKIYILVTVSIPTILRSVTYSLTIKMPTQNKPIINRINQITFKYENTKNIYIYINSYMWLSQF